MKLITADLHFSATPRDAYRLQFLHKRLPALLKTYKVEQLMILGDMCEVKDQHGAWLVNQIVDGLAEIAKTVSSIVVLMGNHDFLQEGHPFFRFTKHIPNVVYRDRPRLVNGNLFLPFTSTPEKDWPAIDMKGAKRIFTHMTFDGATGGFGRKLEGASLDLLPKVPIISGDVHTPQKFANLTYVGAPYTVDFGDDYAGRVLLLDDKRLSSVVVGGPQKRLIKAPTLAGARAGDVVRVEVPIKAKDYSHWSERHEQIRKWADEAGVTLDSVVPVIIDASERAVNKAKLQRAAINDDALLTEYGKAKKIDERTLAIGKAFL
jgi:Calcineurin-like phosphoesterase